MKKLTALLCILGILFSVCLCRADEWLRLDKGDAADNAGSFLVNDYTGEITITFLGDCTLGGETSAAGSSKGFVKTVAREGFGWPFRGLLRLTESDDVTIANLEGVLSDRKLEKETKEFNFKGGTEYTEILREGGIEGVTLANNHSHDYGNAGYSDTKAALDKAGIAYFGADCCAVWERDGLRIGFAGVSFTAGEAFERQVQALWDSGCTAVIVFMHAGLEYQQEPNGYQRAIVQKAAALGCTLVVGSHPHIAQGFAVESGIPVLYSLGNCVFGGNSNPKDKDALVLQAVLQYEEGELTGMDLRFYPISVTSAAKGNNYSPVLLTGADAERVLKKMTASTGYEMPAFDEESGSVIHIPVNGQ